MTSPRPIPRRCIYFARIGSASALLLPGDAPANRWKDFRPRTSPLKSRIPNADGAADPLFRLEVNREKVKMGNHQMAQNRKRQRGILEIRGHISNQDIRKFTVIIQIQSRVDQGNGRSLGLFQPGFPILGVFRLKGQSKRDGSIIVRSCKASLSPVYPIRDAIPAVNHASCPSLSSSGPPPMG